MTKKPASALLLSFLMMNLLILVSIGVSVLVLRDVRTMRTVIAGSQARYAAEGMNELGLLELKENLPGYEPVFVDYEFSNSVLASLEVTARDSAVPCAIRGEDTWRQLSQNESVQLALFAQLDEHGLEIEKVERFYVEFYVGDLDGEAKDVPGDVLRWKILGLNGLGDTEAMSEFIPLFGNHISTENPTVFGSAIPVDRAVPEEYSYAKFNVKVGRRSVFYPAYSIATFLEQHDFSHLVLTNVAQEAIYFRFVSTDKPAVCEYVNLESTADMEFGEARQTIQTVVREGENLPAFDFVLYHTELNN